MFVASIFIFGLVFGNFIPINHGATDNSSLIEWEAPDWIKKQFPYYVSGYDYEDKPVVVIQWGQWDTFSVLEKGGDDLKNLQLYLDQLIERIKSGVFLKMSDIEDPILVKSIVTITDYHGLNGRQYQSRKNLQFQIEFNNKMDAVYESIAYGFIINANPFAEFFLAVSKKSMGKFLERMKIFGTDSYQWGQALLRKIPRDQLVPAYGGDENWQPIKFTTAKNG